MAAVVGGPNPFAHEEWTLGMALRNYFQISLKEIAIELKDIRTAQREDAIAMLEALKVTLILEGYNIVPAAKDPMQRPISESGKGIICLPDLRDVDGSQHSKMREDDDEVTLLPPDVSSCNGYTVGDQHPAVAP